MDFIIFRVYSMLDLRVYKLLLKVVEDLSLRKSTLKVEGIY